MTRSIWVVTEKGAVGMLSQALGLAEALASGGGFSEPEVKELRYRAPYTWAPTRPGFASLKSVATEDAAKLEGTPWPDLLITCGRKSAMLAMAIKREHRATTCIHIQDPKANPENWDMLIVPEHDRVRGPNVLVSKGALHRVTREKLEAGRARWGQSVEAMAHPRVALLIGGNNRYFTLDDEWMTGFVAQLRAMAEDTGASIMATASRRTGLSETNILRGGLASIGSGSGRSQLWAGEGENPYFGYLALADAIIVTCDSVSMISEALATGKPVYLARLPGSSDRFDSFFDRLRRDGLIRWFDGRLASNWTENGMLDDMDAIADKVRQYFNWRP